MKNGFKKLRRLIALTMIFVALASFSTGFVVGYYVHELVKTSKHTEQKKLLSYKDLELRIDFNNRIIRKYETGECKSGTSRKKCIGSPWMKVNNSPLVITW